MTKEEAKAIIAENEIEFDVEDAGMGDGSHTVNYKFLFDSKKEAIQFIEAIKILVNG